MTDLIRHSAANLLAISLALAADIGDVPEDIAAPEDDATKKADSPSSATDEVTRKLEQK